MIRTLEEINSKYSALLGAEYTLVTGEGDRLNLKSKLSQYISLSGIFKDGVPEIPEMEIVAYDPEDVQKLFNFMVNG